MASPEPVNRLVPVTQGASPPEPDPVGTGFLMDPENLVRIPRVTLTTLFVAVALLLLPAIAWLAYAGLLPYHGLRLGGANENYFKELAASLLHGKLDIFRAPGQRAHDLVLYHGKYYLYWPPFPAIVYIPLVLATKNQTHDHLVTASFGALNIALLIPVLWLLSRRYDWRLRPGELLGAVLFWAFGTVHYYMSMLGWVWYVAQIMGQTFLLLSLLALLAGTSRLHLLISGLCFAAATYSKNDLVFAVFLLGAIYWNRHKTQSWVRDGGWFFASFLVFSLLNMAYNAARFDGQMFENGIPYHNMAPYFYANYRQHGYMSLHYVPHNVWTEVFKPMDFTGRYPYFTYDLEGFGLLWASPVFVLLAPVAFGIWQAFRVHFLGQGAEQGAILTRVDTSLLVAAALSGMAIAGVIFLIMGTGWSQYASRYSLDYQFPMLLICLYALKLWRGPLLYTLLGVLMALSFYVQWLGVSRGFVW